jgi:hypothetical protein
MVCIPVLKLGILNRAFLASNIIVFRRVEDIRLEAKSTVKLEACDRATSIRNRACIEPLLIVVVAVIDSVAMQTVGRLELSRRSPMVDSLSQAPTPQFRLRQRFLRWFTANFLTSISLAFGIAK